MTVCVCVCVCERERERERERVVSESNRLTGGDCCTGGGFTGNNGVCKRSGYCMTKERLHQIPERWFHSQLMTVMIPLLEQLQPLSSTCQPQNQHTNIYSSLRLSLSSARSNIYQNKQEPHKTPSKTVQISNVQPYLVGIGFFTSILFVSIPAKTSRSFTPTLKYSL